MKESHDLVQRTAESRVNAMGLHQGRDGFKGDMGALVGHVRRILIMAAVRAQADDYLIRVRWEEEQRYVARRRRQGAE